jgi:S1-C subfamily serine protease
VIIGGVSGRSYAAANGFRPGDIVLSVDGRRVSTVQQLAGVQRGSEVVINRGGRPISGVVRY